MADAPAANKPSRNWLGQMVGIAVAVAVVMFLRGGGFRGHPATRAELLGEWVHKGDDVTVELVFHDDGTFVRHPQFVELRTGTWGTSIPIGGQWVLQDRGVLVLVGGGSFKPYVSGDRLRLQAESNADVAFEFRRKVHPATAPAAGP